MWRYFVKRIALAIVTVFAVMAITFFAMNAIPGGPFDTEKASEPAVKAKLEERFNLDKPVGEQFVLYIGRLFQGDLGISMRNGREISLIIKQSFAISAKLGGISALVAISLGLTLGIIAARYRNKWPDRVIIFFTTLLQSVPSFVLATLLLLIFTTQLKLIVAWDANKVNYLLPVISLAMYPMAYITRLTKSSMLDVMNEDYIRTARAKGVPRLSVTYKHGLRNALLPVITYIGPMIAYILVGSMVVETVFTIGGLGQEFVNSVNNRDYSMIMGTTIFLSIIMVTMNLISDLVYKVVDPRIDFS
ncbi:MAG: ABC transporter permease [Saccharofermentanales bacterium]|jgi:oligopeptide transport system permease protein